MNYGTLISGAFRAAVVLAAGLAAYGVLRGAAAATRRLVLVLTLAAAIAVPGVASLGLRWTVEAPAALLALAREVDEATPASGAAGPPARVTGSTAPRVAGAASWDGFDASRALVLSWLAVAAALLARTVASQLRARAIVRRARRVVSAAWDSASTLAGAEQIEVRVSAELDSPAVIGLFRPAIVIPPGAEGWPVERCRLVLVHELAHVRRRDVLAQVLADVACAVHWCDPLVWVCARRLRVEREIAADDAVLAAGVQPSLYAEELVAVATSGITARAALAMAERSSLEVRVRSILAARLARAPLAARGTIAAAAAGAALAAAAACTAPEVSAVQRASGPVAAPRGGTATDPAIQRAADEELAAIGAEWSPELATILVLDPATGEVLANAGRSGSKPADVAATAAIAPGSTLKPIAIAAALELHAITADQRFDCGPGPRMYGDKALHDASENGRLDLAHLLAVSSNVGASRIFDALGGDNLARWLRRFHFGETPAVPGAAMGVLPAHIESGSYQGAMVAIGEGVTATPLQMIAAYGAIAADGVYHAPTLERGGSTPERLLSAETAATVMGLLETAVVDPTATGAEARVEGVHVAGKTGTAEWTAPDGGDRTYASFVGVADLPSRRIVALVGIEAPPRDGFYGGKAAAPAFARLVKRIRGR